MSLKGLLSKGCLSDKSERNGEGEKWRGKKLKEGEGKKRGNLNQILNGLQISCRLLRN